MPRLKPNTIVYQSRDSFKGYSFDIILRTHRKQLPAKCCLPNNICTLDVEKEQSPQVD